MSLRYGLLGLLAEEPSSGYDLTKRFAVSLGNAWPATHSQIYPEMARLVERGWIVQTSEGPRGRKVYQATEDGLEALRAWLSESDADHTLRHEPILRAFFRWTVEPEEAARQFRRDADTYARKRVELESWVGHLDQDGSPAAFSSRIALEAGLRLYRDLEDWATWAADQMQSATLPSGQPPETERPTKDAASTDTPALKDPPPIR